MKLRIPANSLPRLLFISGLTLVGYCGFVLADAVWFQQKAVAAVEPLPPGRNSPEPVEGLAGRLDMRRLGISVAALEGTTATSLRRAAGHIAGTAAGSLSYRVSSITIVRPTDTGLLASGGAQVLALVTCYPFTFIGSAPERFIVRAERIL